MDKQNNLVLVDKFLTYIERVRLFSNNTIIAYKNDLMQFIEFLNKNWKNINILEVEVYHFESFVSELTLNGVEESSIARKVSSLKSFYKFLFKNGIIKKEIYKLISSIKKKKKLPEFLNKSEINEFMNYLYSLKDKEKDNRKKRFLILRDIAIFELLLSTGIRVSELINIKLTDIDFKERVIKVKGKGNRERIVPFDENTYLALKNYISIKPFSDYIFVNTSNIKLTRAGVFYIIKKRINEGGMNKNISPHKLRHTFATLLMNNGADLKFIKTLLGHSSLASTEVYTHLNIDEKLKKYKKYHPHS